MQQAYFPEEGSTQPNPMEQMGLSKSEIGEFLKQILMTNSAWYLCTVFIANILHSVFSMMAFKNGSFRNPKV